MDLNIIRGDMDQGRLTDLKSKVLKKASSKVIHRNNWNKEVNSSPETNAERNTQTTVKHDNKSNGVIAGGSEHSSFTKKRDSTSKHEKIKQDVRKTHENSRAQKQKEKKTVLEPQSVRTDLSTRRSRRGSFESKSKPFATESSNDKAIKTGTVRSKVSENNTQNQVENGLDSFGITSRDNVRTISKTYTPRKSEPFVDEGASGRIFQTQPIEPTEIYIDPVKGQVRVTAGHDDRFDDIVNSSRTKVLIQPGSPKKSIDGLKRSCSIVDRDDSPEIHREVRDVFGFSTLDGNSINNTEGCTSDRSIAAKSPFAAAKQCNTEVEFWLRGLGIPDVDRYVRILAQNDVDLLDLEFMSASQLHDMGINTFGALDRILKGIRDLKIRPPVRDKRSTEKKKLLDVSCIAWENGDNETSALEGMVLEADCDTLVSTNKTSQSSQSKKHLLDCDTLKSRDSSCDVKHGDSYKYSVVNSIPIALSYEPVRRCGSAMSNVSSSTDRGSRSDSKNPAFAAKTHSSSAKCVDKRPPSAKVVVGAMSSNQKSGTSSKLNSVNSTSSQKAGAGQNKLRRSNSFTAPDRASKLANLEEKPTKGALIRPRSSSLTRESSRNSSAKTPKKTEQKKVTHSTRTRSRSADAVKRKALEGWYIGLVRFQSHVKVNLG